MSTSVSRSQEKPVRRCIKINVWILSIGFCRSVHVYRQPNVNVQPMAPRTCCRPSAVLECIGSQRGPSFRRCVGSCYTGYEGFLHLHVHRPVPVSRERALHTLIDGCRSGLSLTERWAVQGRCPLSSFSKNNSTDSNTLSVLTSFGQESFAPFFRK